MSKQLNNDNASKSEAKGEGIDSITGLYSYRGFLDAAEKRLESGFLQYESVKRTWVVVCFQLEHFDYFNVSCGVEEGDRLLVNIAKAIAKVFDNSPQGHVSMTSFAVYCRKSEVAERVGRVHNALRKYLRSTKFHDVLWLRAGWCSLSGVESVDDLAVAYRNARAACRTLRGRRDQYLAEADEATVSKAKQEREVLRSFDNALERDEIKPYYQPIVDASTAQICDVEVLSRWVNNDDAAQSPFRFIPFQFIPVLEEAGRIYDHDMRILELACKDMQQRMSTGQACPSFSVNLSRRDFEHADLVERVVETADRYSIPHDMLSVEVTESAMTKNAEALKAAIDAFHRNGIKVWLDDFGSGHSSLNVLKDYDFDVLKVDMDFLRRGFERKSKGTPKYEKAKKLLAVIAEMTRSLGIRSLVEGIDESDQHEYLRTLGFGLLQGFYFGQPAPAPGAIVQNEKFEHYEGDMPICQA